MSSYLLFRTSRTISTNLEQFISVERRLCDVLTNKGRLNYVMRTATWNRFLLLLCYSYGNISFNESNPHIYMYFWYKTSIWLKCYTLQLFLLHSSLIFFVCLECIVPLDNFSSLKRSYFNHLHSMNQKFDFGVRSGVRLDLTGTVIYTFFMLHSKVSFIFGSN